MTKQKCHQGKSIKVLQAVRDKQAPEGQITPVMDASTHREPKCICHVQNRNTERH